MKKLFLIAVITVFSMPVIQAQTFKIGGTIGLPTADASDFSTMVLGVDIYYYFTEVDALIQIGGTAGFRNFFGDEVNIGQQQVSFDDRQFLPLAAAGRVKLFGLFSGGVDVGYAIGIDEGNDGGFYARPVLGFDIADIIEINMSYETIANDGRTWGNFNVGALIEF